MKTRQREADTALEDVWQELEVVGNAKQIPYLKTQATAFCDTHESANSNARTEGCHGKKWQKTPLRLKSTHGNAKLIPCMRTLRRYGDQGKSNLNTRHRTETRQRDADVVLE